MYSCKGFRNRVTFNTANYCLVTHRLVTLSGNKLQPEEVFYK
jgi:hypothetical protein